MLCAFIAKKNHVWQWKGQSKGIIYIYIFIFSLFSMKPHGTSVTNKYFPISKIFAFFIRPKGRPFCIFTLSYCEIIYPNIRWVPLDGAPSSKLLDAKVSNHKSLLQIFKCFKFYDQFRYAHYWMHFTKGNVLC